jgi:hypothetical protein
MPTGEDDVRVTGPGFTDDDRMILFDTTTGDTTKKSRAFAVVKIITRYFHLPEIHGNLKTRWNRDVPISSRKAEYPAWLFYCGFGGHFSRKFIWMEEPAGQ